MSTPAPSTSATRQHALLDAAVSVFARYGFRKTSMDEVARAAGVSRQGLYLQFSNKEELFRKAVAHQLALQLAAAKTALASPASLEVRLIKACEEWSGRFVGLLGADAADLMCASTSLAGPTQTFFDAEFEKSVATAISDSDLARVCSSVGFCAADLARALHATARGLKASCKTRDEFLKSMTVAVRMFCMPVTHRIGSGASL
jgi:TetR/AcrR family transcriptional regulator, regulator of autoinduction and epiphytic fitness